MTGFTPELVERLNEEADWLSGAELDGLRLSVGGAVNVMREAASGIAERTEALECAVGIIKDARLLGTESPGLAAFETVLAKHGRGE